MNVINQYYRLVDASSKKELHLPYYTASVDKIYFNLNEIELYYNPLTKTYQKKYLIGGGKKNLIILNYDD